MNSLPGTIHEWVTFLETRDVPVLRRTISEFAKMRPNAENISGSQLAVIILRDPLMTLKLLRLANGSRRGRLSNEITSVEHAIMMMGVGPLFKQFSSLVALEDMLADQEQSLSSVRQVYCRALHAAYQARQWAIQRQDIRVEEVYISALLHDMTNMMLWIYAPARAQEIRDTVRREQIYYGKAHEKVMGFSVEDFRIALVAAWQFPRMLAELADCRNAAVPRAQGVLLAVSIAHLAERGWYGKQMDAAMEAMADTLNLPLEVAIWLIHQTAVAAGRYWEWYGVRPAAAWLPLLPGPWMEDEEPVAKPQANAEEESSATPVCLMPDHDKLQRTIDEIHAHLDGSLDLHQMMTLVLKGLHEGIALNRVAFALITRDRSALRAKYVYGAPPDSPLQDFRVDLDSPNLFTRLLEKMQGVWFSEANAKTLSPMIPRQTLRAIGDGEFFAMSVFVHGKPVGLFYADRKHGDCGLDEHSYLEFKRLCVLAGEGLAHLARK